MSDVDPVGYRAMTRLLNLMTALSLLLCVAVCVLWVRSHWVETGVQVRGDREYDLFLSDGQMRLDIDTQYATPVTDAEDFRDAPALGPERLQRSHGAPGWVYRHWHVRNPRPLRLPHDHVLGFQFSHGQTIYGSRDVGGYEQLRMRGVHTEVWAPLWFPSAVFSLPMFARVAWGVRARWRPRPGLCPRCGYNLRATPERCPECGTAPAPQETVAPPPPAL